jgi:diguanylate cyclase (GGDEF)-like protein
VAAEPLARAGAGQATARILLELCGVAVAAAVLLQTVSLLYGHDDPSHAVALTAVAVLASWVVDRSTAVPEGLDRVGRIRHISGANVALFPAALLLPPLGCMLVGALSGLPYIARPGPVRALGRSLMRMTAMGVAAAVLLLVNQGSLQVGAPEWLAPRTLVAVICAGLAMLLTEAALNARILRVAARLGPDDAPTFEGPPLLRDSFAIALGALLCILFAAPLALVLLVPLVAAQARSARNHAGILEGYRDHKTGLLTLAAFHDLAAREFARLQRSGEPASVLMIDLDGLKAVNTRFGHLAGDAHIMAMGELLARNLRTEDIVARFGGDEFCVMLPGVGLAAAAAVADRIRVEAAATSVGVAQRHLAVSIGATQVLPGDTVDTVISRADLGLLAAKGRGRNRVVLVPGESGVQVQEQG